MRPVAVRVTDGSERERLLGWGAAMAAGWVGLRLQTVSVAADPVGGYARHLAAAWRWAGVQGRPLLWLEGDKVPSAEGLAELVLCPQPWCAVAYRIFPAKTGLPSVVYAQRVVSAACTRWLAEGEQWCDRTGMGCVKFGQELAALKPPEAGEFGSGLDARASDWCRDRVGPCHVHWPACMHVDG